MENNTFTAVSNNNVLAMTAPTLGLGFHQFDSSVSVKEVMEQIGANFEVQKEHLVRIPDAIYEKIINGENVNATLMLQDLIKTHCVTSRTDNGAMLGVVGADYGIIQNAQALDILDLVTNSSVTGKDMKIVSAGIVHGSDPYVQVLIDTQGIINDNSNTQFYAFFHTSHDGTSSLKISFSAVRVVCANTFNRNLREKNGFSMKHTKNVGERVDLTKFANIQRVQEFVKSANFFVDDYIQQMNSFALAKVTENDINNFISKLFMDDKEMIELAKRYGYNYDLIGRVSTRTKNQITAFKDTLESGVGQDTNRGTKLWLLNGTTNYFSNVANYGSKHDSTVERATKRFDNLMDGTSAKKIERAYNLLLV